MALGKIQNIKLTSSRSKGKGYVRVLVLDNNGSFKNLIMTQKDYDAALTRSTKNPDDTVKPGILDKITSWFAQ